MPEPTSRAFAQSSKELVRMEVYGKRATKNENEQNEQFLKLITNFTHVKSPSSFRDPSWDAVSDGR